jgi:hypothetical protein
MLTLFTTAKPFNGHNGIIQRNALKSWKLLHPDVEVILFGNDTGSAETAAQLGLRHDPHVARTDSGAIRLDDMFCRAQTVARHDLLCYSNCDILLLGDFLRALEQVSMKFAQFLMVGRRWDIEIASPIDFENPDWEKRTRSRALAANHQQGNWWIDYFVFSRGFYGKDIPPFAVGRTSWDNWLVWRGCSSGYPVIDASRAVVAVHQNHDYGHHPGGTKGIWKGAEAKRNLQLAGGLKHLGCISDATAVLTAGELRHNYRRYLPRWIGHVQGAWGDGRRVLTYRVRLPVWHFLLDITRPLRGVVGLRSKRSR